MDLLESPNFEWDMGLTVDSTCSTIVNGTMYIVGGPPGNSTQFMKVNDCRLENLGELNWPADRNASFMHQFVYSARSKSGPVYFLNFEVNRGLL